MIDNILEKHFQKDYDKVKSDAEKKLWHKKILTIKGKIIRIIGQRKCPNSIVSNVLA